MNYIKGFWYELYCLAWNAQTTITVVYCDTNAETAKKLNDEWDDKFPVDLFDDFCSRLEVPNPASKFNWFRLMGSTYDSFISIRWNPVR